jgi:hypothetical protein
MTGRTASPYRAQILIDGKPVDETRSPGLSQLVVRQALDAPTIAEATFETPDEVWAGALAAGGVFSVRIEAGETLFSGAIAGIDRFYGADGRRVLKLRAYDRLEALRRRKRCRFVEALSPAAAWAEAAREIGAGFQGPEGGVGRDVVQAGECDLAFLVALSGAQGLHAWLDGSMLRLTTLAGYEEPVELAWGKDLIAARVERSAEETARATRASGWSASAAQTFMETALTARQDVELSIDDFGLAALALDEGIVHALNGASQSASETRAVAQAAMDRAAATATLAAGAARGSARLKPGARLQLAGLEPGEPLTVVATSVAHVFDAANGYVCEFSTAPPEPPPARAPAVALGLVVDIDDPSGGGRVKVALPALGDLSLRFLSVVAPGAGPAKGAAALPDVGDTVAVLFPAGDFAGGLVLGGLYGERKLPRGVTTQDPRAVVVASGGGQRLALGGKKAAVSLSNAHGDELMLDAANSHLTAVGDLRISAMGGTLTIRAQKVDFERI